VGSFLNVCIWRLPREESIVRPSSKCPKCGTSIKPWDNIPVISYILLRGKCRACGEPISIRYPIVEAANGLLYLLVFFKFGLTGETFFYFAFVSALMVIALIDFDHQIIPDEITLPGVVIGLLAGSLLLPDPFQRIIPLGWKASLIGAALGFGLFYLVALLSKGGMGGGDIKMMAMVGAILGWKGVLFTTFAGSLAGSLIGLYLIIFRGRGRKSKIPFGPFLAFGALIGLVFGQEILRWYLGYGRL
jgi:leader peptidase (prepilin peptidase)/N-methyltransferase